MGKKHKTYKPQKRGNSKKTVGKVEFVNVVYLERETIDGVSHIYATCTCDEWRSSAEAKTIQKVALEAKQHVISSDGKCRLRPHDVDTEHPLDYVAREGEE